MHSPGSAHWPTLPILYRWWNTPLGDPGLACQLLQRPASFACLLGWVLQPQIFVHSPGRATREGGGDSRVADTRKAAGKGDEWHLARWLLPQPSQWRPVTHLVHPKALSSLATDLCETHQSLKQECSVVITVLALGDPVSFPTLQWKVTGVTPGGKSGSGIF